MLQQPDTFFYKRLLDHIRYGRNDKAKAMLNEELAHHQAFDNSNFRGMLLHHAVAHNNVIIARKLIKLGADVNWYGGRNTTPLMTAVLEKNVDAVEVLLEANARIGMVDDSGISALLVALDSSQLNPEILEAFASKFRNKTRTNEELAEELIRAKCNMYHAAMLGGVDLMRCMLERGVDVDSNDSVGITAWHLAMEAEDLYRADWLLSKGADVDAQDDDGFSALKKFADQGNKVMMEFLLEHGADPYEYEEGGTRYKLLYEAFDRLEDGEDDKFGECAELLLEHVDPNEDSDELLEVLNRILDDYSCDKPIKMLIARLTMLEMLGEPVDESIMESVDDIHQAKISELNKYHDSCRQALAIEIFEKLSLLDLLNESDSELRMLVRKKTFLREVEKVSSESELSELYSYYYHAMMRCIEKAKRIVKLEDEAILMICKVFEANYYQFYDFARGMVELLDERDLESLVRV